MTPGTVNLVDLAHRVADSTMPLAERRGTRVVVRDPGKPCVAEVDARRVERIVRNLVTNAVDHAEGRDIEILVAADSQSTALAVRDHGVGLREGQAQMVFNRFWRADPARARSTGGTGLCAKPSQEMPIHSLAATASSASEPASAIPGQTEVATAAAGSGTPSMPPANRNRCGSS